MVLEKLLTSLENQFASLQNENIGIIFVQVFLKKKKLIISKQRKMSDIFSYFTESSSL